MCGAAGEGDDTWGMGSSGDRTEGEKEKTAAGDCVTSQIQGVGGQQKRLGF